ncbi:MAG TPA: FtsX-like permease family protein [Acidimicrobiales bacterium]|nr:FtsX-like permease family protein [Acidimicrobiales bacterium]
MFRTALRNLLAHKLRLLATGMAITLGVAFIAGTLVLTDTIQKTFDDLFSDALANTDTLVREEAAFDDPAGGGEQRGRIDASLLDVVADVDGVAVAQGDVWGFAQVVDEDGEPIGNPGTGPPTFGTNWPEGELNTWTLESGRAPEGPDEVVLDKGSADDGGYVAGDRATILVQGAPREMTVAGVATFAGADSPGGATFAMFTTEAAQELVGEVGKFDSISVAAEEGVSQSDLTSRIEPVLPDGVEAITGQEATEENQDAIEEGLSFFSQFMLVFAVVALLVGGFIIFNTFFITVAQRTRENALLRALGATRRQVLTAVLVEALGVGVIASALGLVAGVPLAAGLKSLLAAFGFEIPAGGVVFTTSTAVISFSAGVIVTLLSAISPARKAGKVPPVAAMRDVSVSSTGYGSKERVIVGSAILALGVGALLYGLFGSPSSALAIVGLGVLLVFFGVSALGRTVSLPLSRFIGLPLPRARGIAGQMARENAMRNPKRTAATASALMIGVGLVTFITIFASSTKASFGNTVDKAFTGDFIVTSGQMGMGGGLSPELATRLNELPEVDVAAGIRAGLAEVDGDAQSVIAADQATFDLFDVESVAGSPDDLDATSIAVFEDVAKDDGLSIGDSVPVEFSSTGRQEMTIALIYGDNATALGGETQAQDWMLGVEGFEANFPDQLDSQIFVKKADGTSSSEALAAVEQEADQYPGADVLDQSEYKAEQMGVVDQMLGLVYALLGLAILIALIGIGNTLALSIVERTRELGLLRAVGMTRAQLRSTIRWESVIIAIQGTLLGLVIGVFFGWALVTAMEDEGLNTFALPVRTLAYVVVLAAVAGILAAVLPSRRAARLDVLRAVVTE